MNLCRNAGRRGDDETKIILTASAALAKIKRFEIAAAAVLFENNILVPRGRVSGGIEAREANPAFDGEIGGLQQHRVRNRHEAVGAIESKAGSVDSRVCGRGRSLKC